MSDPAPETAAPVATEEGAEAAPAPSDNGDSTTAAAATTPAKPAQQPSGKTVFVMNIPCSLLFTFEEELKAVFEKHGEIKCIKRGGITVNGMSPTPTLTAFVNYISPESSEKSLVENGTLVGGNPITAIMLRAGPNSVVVDNLPPQMNTECLQNLLAACGNIKEVAKISGRRTGNGNTSIAFVEFEDQEGVSKAVGLTGQLMINNVKLTIEKRSDIRRNKKAAAKTNDKRPAPSPGNANPQGYRRSAWGPGGGWGGPQAPPSGVQGRGGQSLGGGYRGGRGGRGGGGQGFRGGMQGAYGGGGNFWGGNNFNNFNNSMDGDRPNKRRKNEWLY